MVGMLGCESGEPPSESTTQPPGQSNTTTPTPSTPSTAPAPETPSSGAAGPGATPASQAVTDGDPPHFINNIIMTANGGVPGVPATQTCVGTATMYRLVGVQRKHKIRWNIQNDGANPCLNLQISQVELRFENAIMANGVGQGETPLNTLSPPGNAPFIQARVHANPSRAPDNPHAKYVVFYQGQQASPDPELDINGDCGGCGPGGGTP
jgi:hypothetical protein